MTKPQVFLGGSCNPTTWRFDTAIPQLERAGITYYNPQVDDWKPELVEIEARAKNEADTLLIVIDAQTRALASIVEAVENIVRESRVALVVDDIVDGTVISGQTVTGGELKDLNRARAYLRDVASRYNVREYADVADACAAIVQYYTSTGVR